MRNVVRDQVAWSRRGPLVFAGFLAAFILAIIGLPIAAAVSETGLNFGFLRLAGKVYGEKDRQAFAFMQRPLQAPPEYAQWHITQVIPDMPWSVGREIQLSFKGWTYQTLMVYPRAYERQAAKLLKGLPHRYRE